MIFHVARAQIVGMLTLEFGEQISRQFAKAVHQHVQTAPMRHTEHNFLYALSACDLNDVVEQRNKTLAALQ